MLNDNYDDEYFNIQINNNFSLSCNDWYKSDPLESDVHPKFESKMCGQIADCISAQRVSKLEYGVNSEIIRKKKSVKKISSRISHLSRIEKMKNSDIVTEASLAFNFSRIEEIRPKSTFYNLYKRKKLEDSSFFKGIMN